MANVASKSAGFPAAKKDKNITKNKFEIKPKIS